MNAGVCECKCLWMLMSMKVCALCLCLLEDMKEKQQRPRHSPSFYTRALHCFTSPRQHNAGQENEGVENGNQGGQQMPDSCEFDPLSRI